MTPERRAQVVEFLRSFADDVLRDAAAELEAWAPLPVEWSVDYGSPLLKDPRDIIEALRADLAKARERISKLETALCRVGYLPISGPPCFCRPPRRVDDYHEDACVDARALIRERSL